MIIPTLFFELKIINPRLKEKENHLEIRQKQEAGRFI
jgi:hypothetical protein